MSKTSWTVQWGWDGTLVNKSWHKKKIIDGGLSVGLDNIYKERNSNRNLVVKLKMSRGLK